MTVFFIVMCLEFEDLITEYRLKHSGDSSHPMQTSKGLE